VLQLNVALELFLTDVGFIAAIESALEVAHVDFVLPHAEESSELDAFRPMMGAEMADEVGM